MTETKPESPNQNIAEIIKLIRGLDAKVDDLKGEFKSLYNGVDRIRWHFYLVGFSVMLAAITTLAAQVLTEGIHPTMSGLFQ